MVQYFSFIYFLFLHQMSSLKAGNRKLAVSPLYFAGLFFLQVSNALACIIFLFSGPPLFYFNFLFYYSLTRVVENMDTYVCSHHTHAHIEVIAIVMTFRFFGYDEFSEIRTYTIIFHVYTHTHILQRNNCNHCLISE